MKLIEICSLLALILLGLYASVSDMRFGIIKNKILVVFAVYALISDFLMYGIFARDLAGIFLANSAVVVMLSLALYSSHSWAGGDCKLLFVLAFLYPARMYCSYNGQSVTLFFAVAFAFIFGYFYLLGSTALAYFRKQAHFSAKHIGKSFYNFLIAYVRIMVYLTAIQLLIQILCPQFYMIPPMLQIMLNLCLAWTMGYLKVFKKKAVLISALAIDALLSIFLRTIPVDTNISHYLVVFVVVLIQLTVSQQNYMTIPTCQVQKGMILSAATTLLFTASRVKGLPGISTEDLRSRLTAEQAESVRRWEKSATGQPQIMVVKKIPFAIFISLGFLVYFLIWSVV